MVDGLLKRHPLVSDQVNAAELKVLLEQLLGVLDRNVAGDAVELGCYTGTTSLFVQRVLLKHAQAAHVEPRRLYAYDSFAGLPPKGPHDASPAGEQFKSGELLAPRDVFIKHFKQAGLALPVIHKAWFADLQPDDLPPQIAWAFLDGDFYGSIWQSLKLVWPRLSQGAVVIVDDYQSEALPGARKAVDAWLVNHPATIKITASLAILSPTL